METFIRKDFYIDPPAKDATPEQWQAWLESDTKEAIKAKRAYTRSLVAGDLPTGMRANSTRKVNGVWKSVVAIGFAGAEDNTTMEPAVQATQERVLGRARFQAKVSTEEKARRAFWGAKRYAKKMAKLNRH